MPSNGEDLRYTSYSSTVWVILYNFHHTGLQYTFLKVDSGEGQSSGPFMQLASWSSSGPESRQAKLSKILLDFRVTGLSLRGNHLSKPSCCFQRDNDSEIRMFFKMHGAERGKRSRGLEGSGKAVCLCPSPVSMRAVSLLCKVCLS